ncbi:MAG: DUF177 domain-containing protein [Clostridiales bacterium]|jgi:uncharacterized protein|nr:DUF177 domain-containing protein [Clostridiales bacterium]
MHISVEDLKNMPGETLTYTFTAAAEQLDLTDEEVEFLEPLTVELLATYSNGKINVEGSLHSKVALGCSRCLRTFVFPLAETFADEVQAGDMATLDIDDWVREAYFIGLPLKPLCHEACKGLCPRCGSDMNEKQCDCLIDEVDHRLSVLKKLLEEK